MAKKRVLAVEHQSNGSIGALGRVLEQRGVDIDLVGPDTGIELPESLEGYDGLIVLGGSMGPTDDERAPWLPQARALLREGVETNTPTLGICLGGQLLVTEFGGRVESMPGGPEIGLHTVNFTGDSDDELFGAISGSVPVVQWHWLEAAQLPVGAKVFASSEQCANQAFRVSDRAWAVQFHPEVLVTSVAEWAADDQRNLDELGLERDDVVDQVLDKQQELYRVWGEFGDRFAAIIHQG